MKKRRVQSKIGKLLFHRMGIVAVLIVPAIAASRFFSVCVPAYLLFPAACAIVSSIPHDNLHDNSQFLSARIFPPAAPAVLISDSSIVF